MRVNDLLASSQPLALPERPARLAAVQSVLPPAPFRAWLDTLSGGPINWSAAQRQVAASIGSNWPNSIPAASS